MDIEVFCGLVAMAIVVVVTSGFFVVKQQTCAVIERLGKFHRIAEPGLSWRIPGIDSIASRLSFRIHQLSVEVETKTQDNVFVTVAVAVQYRVLKEKVFQAYYTLQDHQSQIKSFVFDLVRAQVPLLILDDVFSKKDDIANAIKSNLKETMENFGYEIVEALITDINPDANVKSAMNEINTAQRLRLAAAERAESEKIIRVKQAEAEAESNILHGRGIAGQRAAIIEGLGHSVEEFVKQIPDAQSSTVMEMVMLIQYIDTLKEIGSKSKSNVVFVPHSPGNLADIGAQIRETLFSEAFICKK
ncbi:MAG: SPFH domain-containing protein [Puniceicoccales bacterium]|jgi:regulator of protease activity HflC (stomatin/prohibitin superfamily)|nr:SPFH domain-containing protein [Puniceicoccales bacterium]